MYFASHDAGALCGLYGGTFVPVGTRVSASCDFRPGLAMCGDGSGTESDVQYASYWRCTTAGGTLSTTSACTATGRTGTCSYLNNEGIDVQERWYGPTTAAAAGCLNPAVWTPG